MTILPRAAASVALAAACAAPLLAQLPAGFVPLERAPVQGAFATRLDVAGGDRALPDVLAEVASRAGLTYAADRALGATTRVSLVLRGVTAHAALVRLTAGTPVQLLVGPRGELVATPRAAARATLRLGGFVRNADSREVVRRAAVQVDELPPREGTDDGTYLVNMTPGTHRLRVRAIGFAPLDTVITLTASRTADLVLRPRTAVLAAVRVQAARRDDERPDLDPRVPDMSTIRLDLGAVRKAPVVLGEPDPIRTLTYLPGVASANDASTAFSVRGGAADQNLVLLDEAPIYNPSHVLGFISTFNSDAVDGVTLYKGAIPARFGGRLSSVVDVRQREGNASRFTGLASIGLLSSRALFEGPLVRRERGSFMVAARRSYADAFLGLANDSTLRDNVLYFFDVNAKANWRLGETGALMLSGYSGRDRFGDADQFDATWGNRSATLRWNQLVAGRLLSKVTLATSRYDYRLGFDLGARDSARWNASIASTEARVDQTWRLSDRNAIEFGVEGSAGRFEPGEVVTLAPPASRREAEERRTVNGAAYLGHEVEVGERLAFRYGVRWAGFERRGPWWRTRYENDAPLVWDATTQRYREGRVLDSTRVSGRAARYDGWEPRFSMRLMLTPTQSLKLSGARTQQFVQLVSNTTAPTPLDVWEPAGPWIRPQRADQAALGWSWSPAGWEVTTEAYVKRMRNVVDYVDGADLLLNTRLETMLVQGTGRARGVELFVRRTTGRTTGWLSYTLGRAEQRFPTPASAGPQPGSGINGGRWYVTPYDRTHNLALVLLREAGPRWTFGSTFLLASGLPTTLPQARYVIDGLLVPEYGPRNGARLPMYHRLDLNATRRLGRGELQFGVLNAYNRFNAQSLRTRQSRANPLVAEAVQYSVFGIVPSLSYTYRW